MASTVGRLLFRFASRLQDRPPFLGCGKLTNTIGQISHRWGLNSFAICCVEDFAYSHSKSCGSVLLPPALTGDIPASVLSDGSDYA
jgi:hypothetical protein